MTVLIWWPVYRKHYVIQENFAQNTIFCKCYGLLFPLDPIASYWLAAYLAMSCHSGFTPFWNQFRTTAKKNIFFHLFPKWFYSIEFSFWRLQNLLVLCEAGLLGKPLAFPWLVSLSRFKSDLALYFGDPSSRTPSGFFSFKVYSIH